MERAFPNAPSLRSIEPFEFDSKDPIAVQVAGRKLAVHLGMPECTFVITYAKQRINTAGHIHIEDSHEVFVEIDPSHRDYHQIVLYILAHELCHKLLFRKGIRLQPEIDNEIFTDIAVVYFGMGKLALNGCEYQINSPRRVGGELKRLGYINRYHFAFVYALVCTSHKLKPNDYYRNLTSEAIQTIRQVKDTESVNFHDVLFQPASMQTQWDKHMEQELKQYQTMLASTDRWCRIQLTSRTEGHHHLRINQLREKTGPIFQSNSKHPSLLYLENLYAFHLMRNFQDSLAVDRKSLKKEISRLETAFEKSTVAQSRLKIDPGLLRKFQCPICTSFMSIREHKLARVICPDCSYAFIVDTRIEIPKDENSIKVLMKKWIFGRE